MQAARSYRLTAAHLAGRTLFLVLLVYPAWAPAQNGVLGLGRFATVGHEQENLAGTYRGRASARDAARRVYTLNLALDGSARFTTLYVGKDSATERGHWTRNGSELVLTFNPMGPNTPPGAVTFRYHHDALYPIHWDPSEWGEDGPPVLRRDLAPADPAGS